MKHFPLYVRRARKAADLRAAAGKCDWSRCRWPPPHPRQSEPWPLRAVCCQWLSRLVRDHTRSRQALLRPCPLAELLFADVSTPSPPSAESAPRVSVADRVRRPAGSPSSVLRRRFVADHLQTSRGEFVYHLVRSDQNSYLPTRARQRSTQHPPLYETTCTNRRLLPSFPKRMLSAVDGSIFSYFLCSQAKERSSVEIVQVFKRVFSVYFVAAA